MILRALILIIRVGRLWWSKESFHQNVKTSNNSDSLQAIDRLTFVNWSDENLWKVKQNKGCLYGFILLLVICAIIYPVSRLAGAVFQINRPNGFIKVIFDQFTIFHFDFKSECMRYDGEREILVATPFRDLSETIKYGNVISPIISARNCWNPIDLTVLLSSVILIGIVVIILFIGCCAFACKFIKKKCKSSHRR